MMSAPAGQEKRGLLAAPQLFQHWGLVHPNLKPPILHLGRASGPLLIHMRAANFFAQRRLHLQEAPAGPE